MIKLFVKCGRCLSLKAKKATQQGTLLSVPKADNKHSDKSLIGSDGKMTMVHMADYIIICGLKASCEFVLYVDSHI